ncbi:hypothetical protein DFJ73DRAFT_800971 [Zopfochytrium polystomum]|nr:hypothetical protein DFJ73DRAFT_800971 [Zopfochytrium polystomum]
MRILVVGGGVSGPAAALALKRAGHDVELFDRVLDFLDAPAGLNVSENGMRVLKRLGLLDAVVTAGSVCDSFEMRKINGDPVASFPTSRSGDLVQINILRTTLSRILTNTLIQEGVYVHANKQLIGIEQPTDGSLGVRAKFHDGSVAVGDILIGADGVHSGVRQCLFPDRKPSKYGIVGYFGIVDLDPSTINWTSRSHHFFTDNVAGKSGMVMRVSDTQLGWLLFELKQSEITLDSWKPLFDLREERASLAEMARRWRLPDVFQPMILGAKEIVPLTIYDLETLPHWSKQNCVLIGGAKHAMVPFLGQTCGVGLEDAEVLAALISRFPAHSCSQLSWTPAHVARFHVAGGAPKKDALSKCPHAANSVPSIPPVGSATARSDVVVAGNFADSSNSACNKKDLAVH